MKYYQKKNIKQDKDILIKDFNDGIVKIDSGKLQRF